MRAAMIGLSMERANVQVNSFGKLLEELESHSPKVVFANAISTVADAIPASESEKNLQIHVGAQLSGPPHVGTALTLGLAFSLGALLRKQVRPATVQLELLDNCPVETRWSAAGAAYRRPLALDQNRHPREEFGRYYGGLVAAAREAGAVVAVRYYSDLQAQAEFRENLRICLRESERLVPIIAPRTGKLPIRMPCPQCNFVEVHASSAEQAAGKDVGLMRYVCDLHGPYVGDLRSDGTFVDVSAIVRNIARDMLPAQPEVRRVTVKGMDWVHGCSVVDRTCALLGIGDEARPLRLFAPLVTAPGGAKLSKSESIGRGQEWVIGAPAVDRLLTLCGEIIRRPRLFFRNYDAELIGRVLAVAPSRPGQDGRAAA